MPTLLFFLYIKNATVSVREVLKRKKATYIIGVDNVGDPPVSIPNTVVKPKDAENT